MAYYRSKKRLNISSQEQTGSIVTFNSQYAGLPLKSCKVNIPVTQEGTGDPSPYNVRNFVGVSAINISHSNRNLLPYTFEDIISANGGQSTWIDNQKTINGLIFTLNTDSNGKLTSITINGTATYNTAFYLNSRFTSIYFPASTLYSGVSSNVAGYSARISHSGGQIISSITAAVAKKNYNNCDIILFFNSGNTFDITVSPRLILSGESDNSYVPHEGVYITINFGQTIYAGELDVLKGIFTVTHGYIASYNEETINEPWISSMDEYVEGTTPTNGAQVVYPLATPEVINLGGMDIATLQGENNLFASTGETTVEYIKIQP